MEKRTLGRSGIEVTPLGLGCMRLASWYMMGRKLEFAKLIDEEEAITTIQMAIEAGINIFDTAAVYGAGSNERLLGKAIKGNRDKVIVITKGGYHVDEKRNMIVRKNGEYIEEEKGITESPDILERPEDIKEMCEESLKRLGTDYIDIYLLHTFFTNNTFDLNKAAEIRDYMEELVEEGKIRWYGWSTDWPHQAEVFLKGKHCTSIMHDLNIFSGNEETLKLCEENNLASINRTPLAGGSLLVDQPEETNYRGEKIDVKKIEKMKAIKEILTSDGRGVVQGLIGWLWAKSEKTIPNPGWDTREHVEGLIKSLEYGPLSAEQMAEIETLKDKMD